MPLPDVVIAGAPKSGTTSLFSWLSAHPGVCPSKIKETCYLMDRESPLFNPERNFLDHGLEGYADMFAHCRDVHRVHLEATPDYLYQRTAPAALAGMPGPPLALFILRKPSERAYSAWRFYHGHKAAIENALDFPEFIRRVLAGNPFEGPMGRLLDNVVNDSRYVRHLRLWEETLGREHMRLCLFEDMRADPRAFMRRLCNDIGIAPDPLDDLDHSPSNVSYAVRSAALQRMRNRIARRLPRGGYRKITHAVYSLVNRKSTGYVRTRAHLETLAQLDDLFAEDNDRLANAYGLDLSPWAAPQRPRP